MIVAAVIVAPLVLAASVIVWLLMRQGPLTRDDIRKANIRHYRLLLSGAADSKTRESLSKKLDVELAGGEH